MSSQIGATKAIATLVISSSVLVALMGISLSLPQTASAASFASCPEGTDRVKGNTCFADPIISCPDGQHFDAKRDKCVGGGQGNTEPQVSCPEGFSGPNARGECTAKTGSK